MGLLKKFKKEIKKLVKLEKMIFFGSRAIGKGNETSDVDLILVSNNFVGKTYFKRSPKFYLLWDFPYDIDIICLTEEELDKKQEQIGIIKQAVKEGIEI